MDIKQIGTFVNSSTFRSIKTAAGVALVVSGIRTAANKNKKSRGIIPMGLGAVLAGTAALDLCPLNLALGLPLQGESAREILE